MTLLQTTCPLIFENAHYCCPYTTTTTLFPYVCDWYQTLGVHYIIVFAQVCPIST